MEHIETGPPGLRVQETIMLDFRMETFLTVCQYMNFTKAAEVLNITQPAVSQHVRHLEKHYKVKLFRYEGKKPRLTPAGEMLRSAALTMTHDEISLEKRMQSMSKELLDIRFGATMTVGEAVMARILKRYLAEYPESHLHMEVGNTQELLQKMDHGEIDFALVEGFFKKSEYDFLHYSTENYIAVCSPDYIFQRKIRRLEDLFGERLLLREPGSGTREVLERYLDSQNFSIDDFAKTAEIGSLHTIKELTKEGLGITFLYEVAVREEMEKGELMEIRIRDFKLSHDFTFIWRRGSIYADTYRTLFQRFSEMT